MLENVLFLLLGALLGSLLGRASKQYDRRKEWYRRVGVELSYLRTHSIDPDDRYSRSAERTIALEELVMHESHVYGTEGDIRFIEECDDELDRRISSPDATETVQMVAWADYLDEMLDYFLPKAR